MTKLTELPGDARVLVQKDSEGNGYKQAYGVEIAYSEDAEAWQPESAHSEEDLDEMIEDSRDSGWEVNREHYTEVVVLY